MKLSVPHLEAKRAAAMLVTLVTLGYWLVILTYPQFYIFNPLETKLAVFRFLQIFSTAGCVLFAFFPILFAWLPEINGKSTRLPYLVASLLWPVSIFVIQLTVAFQGGSFYSYIARDPIFALNDLVAPLFLLAVTNTLFSTKRTKSSRKSKR